MKSIYAKLSLCMLFSSYIWGGPKEEYKSYWFRFEIPGNEKDFELLVKKIIPLDISGFKKYAESITLFKSEQKILALLRVMSIKPPEFPWSELKDARAKRQFLIEILLKNFPDAKKYIVFVLTQAYKDKDRKLIKLLRSHGVDISLALSDALENAEKGWIDIASKLIKDGAIPDEELTIRMQSSKDDAKFLSVLPQWLKALKNGNQRFREGRTLLFYVLGFDESYAKKITNTLLRAGLDINAQDNYGNTVLLRFVDEINNNKSNLGFISFLMNHGADPMIKNNAEESAMSLAKKRGLSELVALFGKSRK